MLLMLALGWTAAADPAGESAAVVPEDGVYVVDFETDSSMFHVNEAHGGKALLFVEEGRMYVHVTLQSKNIVKLFAGRAEDAKAEGADLLLPTTDTVTYPDGYTENVYGFDIPVPALGEEFDVAIIGKKNKWYDHRVSVVNAVPAAEADAELFAALLANAGAGAEEG